MSLYINNKKYTTNIVIDKGLSNVNITETDIKPGKVSIDNKGNKIVSSSDKILSALTSDATALPSDITNGKTLYNNGVKITGTAQTNINVNQLINGTTIRTYPVALSAYITAGDFVRILSDNTISNYVPNLSITGIALQSGSYPSSIQVIMP